MSLSKLNNLWMDYLDQLERNPVFTKSCTSAVLSAFSDLLAQSLAGKGLSTIDWSSTRNQFIIGLLVRGPFVHYWYVVLEQTFTQLGYGDKKSAASLPVALGKVFLDQVVFSPPYNLLYFYLIGFAEGRALPAIHEKIGNEFVPLMLSNWKVWPIINLLNFKFVPPQLRVLFGNIVSIFWMTYVIQLTSKK